MNRNWLPNLISSLRFVLAVAFVLANTGDERVGLIAAAAATDFLDGWVARRVHATSKWGALLDPIADRVFVLTVVGSYLYDGLLTTTGYFVLILRDLATAIGFLAARAIPWLRPVYFKARYLGKLVTVLQLAALAGILLVPVSTPYLLAAVALVSVLAIVDYTLTLWRERAT